MPSEQVEFYSEVGRSTPHWLRKSIPGTQEAPLTPDPEETRLWKILDSPRRTST